VARPQATGGWSSPGGETTLVAQGASLATITVSVQECRLLSRTWKNRSDRPFSGQRGEEFRCKHCGKFVGPVPSGGSHRNHCPFCLYSRHVDETRSGDRASMCGGSMEPIGQFTRLKGEHVIVHRCLSCGFERYNRIAADDDFDRVLSLPQVEPRGGPRRDETGLTEEAPRSQEMELNLDSEPDSEGHDDRRRSLRTSQQPRR
jgi:hypothetical protein